ncbi:NAD(P)H-dependent flavin oxidoreductase [Chloroflexota bacterium]
MNTRINELLKVEYPIVLAGMGHVSSHASLVAAVCNAGGFGFMALATIPTETVREEIRKVKELTGNPFGVNIPLMGPGIQEKLEISHQENVRVVATSLGNPKPVIDWGKARAITMIHTGGSPVHAVRAEQAGADAVIVTGTEGGGHISYIGSIALIPQTVDQVKIPVIAGGGICDARGFVAALSLGAEAIMMGTRFALSKESPLPENIKQRMLRATGDDTVATDAVTGKNLRTLKNKYIEDLLVKGRRRPSVWETITGAFKLKRSLGASTTEALPAAWKAFASDPAMLKMLASGERLERGLIGGDEEEGVLLCGQGCGVINNLPSCKEIIDNIVSEAKGILESTSQKIRP